MLVARAQLNFIRDLVARFERDGNMMLPISEYQSQYVAIIVLLRSVGHVFEKVDCAEADRRKWNKERWPLWKNEPIFKNFIQPTRDALLKEFKGSLKLNSEAFGPIAVVADPLMPGGVSHVAGFNARQARDLTGNPVLPNIHEAIAFWDRCLREAEVAFDEAPVLTY